jgi:hypothetical protein
MSMIDEIRKKVQRILTDELGRVEIDRDGDYVLHHESAVVFVSLQERGEEANVDVIIRAFCPLVVNVPITTEVFKWVATEGQSFFFGSCVLFLEDENEKFGRINFGYSIVGNDLDPNELQNLIYSVMFTGNTLAEVLKGKFGGLLFSET